MFFCFGFVLDLLLDMFDLFEHVWKLLKSVGTILGVFWDMFGTFVDLFCKLFGTILGSVGNMFETMLEDLGNI